MEIVISSEPELPQLSPEMMQNEFEPSVSGLFLVIEFGVVQNVSALNLGPMEAESSFEKVLPAYFVLGVDESSKDGFSVVGIHLEVLVCEGASNALDEDESKIELRVIGDECVA